MDGWCGQSRQGPTAGAPSGFGRRLWTRALQRLCPSDSLSATPPTTTVLVPCTEKAVGAPPCATISVPLRPQCETRTTILLVPQTELAHRIGSLKTESFVALLLVDSQSHLASFGTVLSSLAL